MIEYIGENGNKSFVCQSILFFCLSSDFSSLLSSFWCVCVLFVLFVKEEANGKAAV